MCGFCGIYSFDPQGKVSGEELRSMIEVLRHRGPDDEGFYIREEIGFAHRRLSIIDLATGHQPMTMRGERAVIVYNGEVYNYLELREDLERKGRSFQTKSDTEVILANYLEKGIEGVKDLNGMFAFALWDGEEKALFLVRDRLGIKPLYYLVDKDRLAFASECKSLLRLAAFRAEPHLPAIDDFLTLGYGQGEETPFKGIRRLLPGTYLKCRAKGIIKKRYWDLPSREERSLLWKEGGKEEEAGKRLRVLLEDSIRLRLRSDVPLGIFLSGGIDSSLVVGLLAAKAQTPLKTFSIGFDAGKEFNELAYARLISETFRTEHHEMILSPEAFKRTIPDFIYYMDEPNTESPAISLYHIARCAREHVTVILSGEGADEIFAGYPIYHKMALLDGYRKIPSFLRIALLNPVLRTLFPGWKTEKYLRLSARPLERRYTGVHLLNFLERENLYRNTFRDALGSYDCLREIERHYQESDDPSPLQKMLYLDSKIWLPNDILLKADKMTMASSLELRVPFLDHRIVEFAYSLPARFKLRGGRTKVLLKKTAEGILPSRVIHRKKMGFPTPISLMFRKELSGYLRDLLLEPNASIYRYVNYPYVRERINRHLSGQEDHHLFLWQMLVLEEWHRKFIGHS